MCLKGHVECGGVGESPKANDCPFQFISPLHASGLVANARGSMAISRKTRAAIVAFKRKGETFDGAIQRLLSEVARRRQEVRRLRKEAVDDLVKKLESRMEDLRERPEMFVPWDEVKRKSHAKKN